MINKLYTKMINKLYTKMINKLYTKMMFSYFLNFFTYINLTDFILFIGIQLTI